MLAEEGAGGIEMSKMGGNPPAWVASVESVETLLAEIQRQMDQLQSMHATRLGSVFGKDLDDMEGRIERLTDQITDKFRHCERHLQKVGIGTKAAGGQQAVMGSNIQRRYVFLCRYIIN